MLKCCGEVHPSEEQLPALDPEYQRKQEEKRRAEERAAQRARDRERERERARTREEEQRREEEQQRPRLRGRIQDSAARILGTCVLSSLGGASKVTALVFQRRTKRKQE